MKLILPQEIRKRTIVAVVACLTVIVLAAFEWSIIDRITPFLWFPLSALVWVFFLGSAIASTTCIAKYRRLGLICLSPLGIQVAALLVVYFVPFTQLWLNADFAYYRTEREEVVRKVLAGELRSNVRHNANLIFLGKQYPLVSMGGNEIVVEEHSGKKYVFFYTFRGILDNYAGFIYVPEGGDPRNYSDLEEKDRTELMPLDGNWFYASHH